MLVVMLRRPAFNVDLAGAFGGNITKRTDQLFIYCRRGGMIGVGTVPAAFLVVGTTSAVTHFYCRDGAEGGEGADALCYRRSGFCHGFGRNKVCPFIRSLSCRLLRDGSGFLHHPFRDTGECGGAGE